MERAVASAAPPMPTRRLLRIACGLVLFLAFGALGRRTVIDQDSVSLIWPAAGVAALWLATGNRRTWPGDAVALAVATFAVNVATGATPAASLAFTASNVLQVGVFVVLVHRWLGRLWGLGGSEPLNRLRDLGLLTIAAVAAAFVGATIGGLGLAVTGPTPDPAIFVVWWGRNAISVLVFTLLGLLAGPQLFRARSTRELGRILYDALHARTLGRLIEAELLVAVSVVLYALLFGQRDAQPLSFLVLAVSVWAGLRFSPLAVMAHGIAVGITGLVFTLNGYGPFAAIESPLLRALVAQVFVATAVLTGLALAFSLAERNNASRHLAQARREADERARLLGAVLESMSEGLAVVEEGGRVLVSNPAAQSLLGLSTTSDQVRPAAAYRLFHDDGTPVGEHDLPAYQALAGNEVEPADYHLRADTVPEGRVLEISARPLAPEDAGEQTRAMVNIRDVTVDRQHRDALASFAGVVAHDLFNPLTIVNGWAEELEAAFHDGSVSPGVGLPMVARVHEAASHMRDVIGDLLAYTVARDQSLKPAAVDLTAELRALALLRIDGPAIPLITVAPDLHAWVDPGLARQLFDNLLGNAVKYVAPGVRPRVDIRGRRDGDWLEVRVTDNGIGIPADERELVFETFHRAHEIGYQGTGLGLAICRRIADRHGGSIHAEAGPQGLGTTFVIRLPATSVGYGTDPVPPRAVVRQPAARESVGDLTG